MELFIIVVMEKVRLRVQTVPASDPVTHQEHTAFTVIREGDGPLQHAPGWTLRDAIDNYCEWFKVARENVCVLRPFVPQSFINYE